jgi:hypothetical protein
MQKINAMANESSCKPTVIKVTLNVRTQHIEWAGKNRLSLMKLISLAPTAVGMQQCYNTMCSNVFERSTQMAVDQVQSMTRTASAISTIQSLIQSVFEQLVQLNSNSPFNVLREFPTCNLF